MMDEANRESAASSYRWWMLFLGSLVLGFVAGVAWNIMPVLFQEIAQPKDSGLGLNLVQLGAVWGMMPLALALLALPAGIMADRYGVRWIIGFGVILTAIAGALRGTSGSFASLLVWMFLFGVGYAAIGTNIPKFVGTWFHSKELGMANGIVFSCFGIGSGLSIQFGGAFFSPAVGGWRNVLYILGIISLAIGILWLTTVKNPKSDGMGTSAAREGISPRQALFRGLAIGFKTRDVWLLVICQMLFLAGNLGMMGYLPMYLVSQGMTKAVAHGYASIGSYFFVIGSIVVPMFSDWIGTRKFVYVVTIAICGVFCMLLPFISGLTLGVALAAMGFCGGGYVIPRIIPVEHPRIGVALAGSVFGFIVAMGFLAGFISPMVGNAVAAKAGGAVAITLWGSFFLVAAFIFLFVTETHPKRAAKVGQAG